MVESSAQLDAVFHALADPTRRSLLRKVARGRRSVTELARPYKMSLAAVSKHLRVLENAKLIARSKQGSFHFVRLHAEAMKPARDWFLDYEAFWSDRLDALTIMLEGPPHE
jgi:DNA-binding transcriptional ArsR family regulator